jgi:amidohydrolase
MSNELIQLRRWLHSYPELSGDEAKTAAQVVKFIAKLQPDSIITTIGGNGILVLFDSGKPGKAILFRSELDALPIHEVNKFAYRSVTDGISHKCGHDGHTTILCGLAEKLAANRPLSGKVYLLFQPAEETGEGAQLIVDDIKFDIQPDLVFALHNLPGYKTGVIVVKEGLFSAAVNSIDIKLTGKTSHAAEPEMGINPAKAISEIISFTDKLSNNRPEKDDFSVVTPIYLKMGTKAYGVSAGYGEVHYTLRCWDNNGLKKVEKKLISAAEEIARKHELTMEYQFTQTFYANINDKEANELVKLAAKELNFPIEERKHPFKWAEDFGFFTSRYQGCMFGIGAGQDHPALHNPDYDFPDEIIEKGVYMFDTIARLILK